MLSCPGCSGDPACGQRRDGAAGGRARPRLVLRAAHSWQPLQEQLPEQEMLTFKPGGRVVQ